MEIFKNHMNEKLSTTKDIPDIYNEYRAYRIVKIYGMTNKYGTINN